VTVTTCTWKIRRPSRSHARDHACERKDSLEVRRDRRKGGDGTKIGQDAIEGRRSKDRKGEAPTRGPELAPGHRVSRPRGTGSVGDSVGEGRHGQEGFWAGRKQRCVASGLAGSWAGRKPRTAASGRAEATHRRFQQGKKPRAAGLPLALATLCFQVLVKTGCTRMPLPGPQPSPTLSPTDPVPRAY